MTTPTTCSHCGAELVEKDALLVCKSETCGRSYDAEGVLVAFGPEPEEPVPAPKTKKNK